VVVSIVLVAHVLVWSCVAVISLVDIAVGCDFRASFCGRVVKIILEYPFPIFKSTETRAAPLKNIRFSAWHFSLSVSYVIGGRRSSSPLPCRDVESNQGKLEPYESK